MSQEKLNQISLDLQKNEATLHELNKSISEVDQKRENEEYDKISVAFSTGKTAEELIALGFNKKIINLVVHDTENNTPNPSTPEPVDEQEDNEEGEEKKEDLTVETETKEDAVRQQDIFETVKKMKALRIKEQLLDNHIQQLALDLAKLDEQEKLEKDTNEAASAPENTAQENRSQSPDRDISSEKLPRTIQIVKELQLLKNEKDAVRNPVKKYWPITDLNKRITKLEKELRRAEEEEKFIKKILSKDYTGKEFMYFTAERITSPHVRNLIRNNEAALVDLRFIPPNQHVGDVHPSQLKIINATDAILAFNTLGFMKVLKDAESYRHNGEIDIDKVVYSNQGFYKITGPDGTTIADNIEGYRQAKKQYEQLSQKYKNKVEEEFNAHNK